MPPGQYHVHAPKDFSSSEYIPSNTNLIYAIYLSVGGGGGGGGGGGNKK
jgi:hypothetical protein